VRPAGSLGVPLWVPFKIYTLFDLSIDDISKQDVVFAGVKSVLQFLAFAWVKSANMSVGCIG